MLKKFYLNSAALVRDMVALHVLCGTCAIALADSIDLKIASPLPISKLPNQSNEVIRGLQVGARIGGRWCEGWDEKKELKIHLTWWDDGANKDQAKLVAERIAKEGAHAVIGHINSGTAIPASAVYEKARIPNFSTGATNPLFTDRGFQYNFRIVADDFELSKLTGTHLAKIVSSDILFIHDETSYGKEVVGGMLSSELGSMAEKKIGKIEIPEGEIKNRIPEIIELTSRTSVLVIGGMDLYAGTLLDTLPHAGKTTVVGGQGICSNEMAERIKMTGGVAYCGSQDIEVDSSVHPVNKNFGASDIYSKLYGEAMTLTAARTVDAVGTLVQAMCRAKSLSGEDIVREIKSGKVFKGVAGDYQFSDDGRNIRAKSFLYKMDNNGMKLISTLESTQQVNSILKGNNRGFSE